MNAASAHVACIGKPRIRKPRQPKGERSKKDAQPRSHRPRQRKGTHDNLDADAPEANKQAHASPKDFVASIATTSNLNATDVKAVLDALPDAVAANLRLFRKVVIPHVVVLKLKNVKGTPERKKHLFGKTITIKEKGPSVKVCPLIMKSLKLAVA